MRLGRPSLRIRTRIALSICAVSTGLLVLMSVAVYAVFDRQLIANLDDTLSLRSETNLQLIDTTVAPPALRVTSDPNHELRVGEAVLRLYSVDGTLLVNASPATGLTVEEQRVVTAAIDRNADVFSTIDLHDDEDYRVLASPVRSQGTLVAVLITGLERSRVQNPLSILRLILFVAVPVTAIAAGLGGYWIARRALHPVAAMTATARRITHEDLHQRVEGAGSDDELGQLARTLNSMIARLAETFDRERRFTADASHELRTPLAAIETGIDVTLAQERTPAEYRRVLTLVRRQAGRMHTLANQLLLLSRLDAEEIRHTFAIVDLSGLIEAVVESFRTVHETAMVKIEGAADPLDVRGDFELLARAFLNLLENAVSHVGPTVVVTIALCRGLDGTAIVAIEDDGPGIPDALATEIFQRFRRGDSSRAEGGAGLGLAIVDAIVRGHGGAVGLAPSRCGRGSRFEITLPPVDAG
jgi:heavy metal sensor kinase